ncbi:MAG: hypothetical protein CMJ18_15605 [Phycisphaeraceae bacterium]|nr:hypothetical protein [Phycisphaeraceae bacterium]
MAHVLLSTKVLVLATGGRLEPVLGKIAEENGWSILEVETLPQAVKHIQFNMPRMFIVQVTEPVSRALQLTSTLRSHLPHVPLLAVALCDDHNIELSVRRTGAYYYFPDLADPDRLAQLVEALLKQP